MSQKRLNKLLLQITPFLFLLLIFIISLLAAPPEPSPEPAITASRDVVDTPPAEMVMTPTTLKPTATASSAVTSIPLPSVTPYPRPPDSFTITIFGPPAATTLAASQTAVIYWSWPAPLKADQLFYVQLRTAEGTQRFGPVNRPNLGNAYRLQLPTLPENEYLWSIHLESTALGEDLRASGERRLQIVSN